MVCVCVVGVEWQAMAGCSFKGGRGVVGEVGIVASVAE